MQPIQPVTLPASFTVPSSAQAQLPPRPDPSVTWGDAATVLSLLASLSTLLRN